MAQILDYSAGYPGGAAVERAGYEGVIRYLRKEGSSRVKPITAAELADMQAHGRTVALVYQHIDQARPTQGRAAGRHDAEWARARAAELGASDAFIYLAVDFDATPATVVEYFIGAGEVLGVARLGAYGGVRVLARLFDDGLIGKGWQTAAWSGGRRDPRAHLFQRIGQVTVGGISCDVNDILRPDYGQIGGEEDMTPEEREWLRQMYLSHSQPSKQLGKDVGEVFVELGGVKGRLIRIEEALAELAARPPADVDESALADELIAGGLTGGATPEQVKEAIRAVFARAGQPEGNA